MSQDLILSLIAFAFVTAMTPGPNNTMLLTSGVNFGFNRTRPHVLGVTIGFTIMILAVGLGIGRIFTEFPPLYSGLRIVSVVYLMWLAWRIATAGTSNPIVTDEARPMTFFEAALFQWVNPKGWMVAWSVAANYVSPENLWADLMALSAIFLVVSLIRRLAGSSSARRSGRFCKTRRRCGFSMSRWRSLVASLWPIVREMI